MLDYQIITALISIIIIDIVLAGDNALVIAMAARRLSKEQRNKAIVLGTVGAVVIRVIMTIIAVELLKIPYLQAVGGLLLILVAWKLLADDGCENIEAAGSLMQAIKTIIIADAVMGVDNVLAIAGASHGNIWLVLIGLAISIPIVVWGSRGIAWCMNRYPSLVYVGAGVLAWTAGTMIVHDKSIGKIVAGVPMASVAIPLVLASGIIVVGKLSGR